MCPSMRIGSIPRRYVASQSVPYATKAGTDLFTMTSRPQQKIYGQAHRTPEYAAHRPRFSLQTPSIPKQAPQQSVLPSCEIVKREIQRVSTHVVTADRRKLVKPCRGSTKF